MARSETAAQPAATARSGTSGLRARVVQVVATGPGGRRRASGYLVSRGRVLTAAHGLAGATGIEVRFPAAPEADREFEASVAFLHTGIDVAVLDFHSPHEVPAAQFGGLGERDLDIECHAVGFPLFKLRTPQGRPGFREAEDARARCSTLSNWREGTLDLRLSDPPSATEDPRPERERDGDYQPWQGMSGAAVFSEGRIVGVVVRHHLSDGGRLTASRVDRWAGDGEDGRLTPGELHELERLLGCGGLGAAGRLPAVPAAATAQLPKGVRTHQQETAVPSNRDKYLTGQGIPSFVSPGEGHAADPDQLLERLAELSAPGAGRGALGVVLVGAAGSGKSRTCFEVAERAHNQNWSVLHVAAKASVSSEELAGVVAALHAAGEDVLLVFDYLDSYRQLNLRDFTDELGTAGHSPAGGGPPARLACIASLRPGAVQRARTSEYFDYFERRDLCQEQTHQEAVTRSIVESVAPEAVVAYGRDEVVAVCGQRPVLAMLIAAAIESRVKRKERDVLNRPGLRKHRGLSTWLQRRTDDDFAGHRTSLLASAVAAACCTQEEKAVRDAVTAFLELHGDRDFTAGGIGVIQHLTELGWLLESDGKVLDVMHDFVADELLQQALLPQGQLQDVAATRMFAAFLTTTRTLGLAAHHVQRWTADLDPPAQLAMRRVCDDWLTGETRLRERLRDEPDLAESGRTLLALLSGPPWQSGAVQAWDELVEPWLERAGREAPHLAHGLLTDAVRNSSGEVPERLSGAALRWYQDADRPRHEVRGVLEVLLRTTGVCNADRREAARIAVRWLTEHGTTWGARPLALADALLCLGELPEDTPQAAVEACLAVAGAHIPVPVAGHLLDRLLSRSPLEPEHRERALRLAVRWLARHPGGDAASFLLATLLDRADLTQGQAVQVAAEALAWLDEHGTSPRASFVISRLLGHAGLRGEQHVRAREFALKWLGAHPREHSATFVLGPLLGRTRPDQGAAADVVRHTVDWLTEHGTCEDAHFVLRSALERPELLRADTEKAAGIAMDWLNTGDHGTREAATSVLGPLLKLRRQQRAPEHCAAGLRWLDVESNLASEQASFVFEPLLRRGELGPHAYDAGRLALEWLEGHPQSENVSFVLDPLLALRDLDEEHVPRAVDLAFAALGPPGSAPRAEARFVLAPLLRGERAGARAAPLALAWLREFATIPEASHVLAPLLGCRGLEASATDEAARHALAWLDVHHGQHNARWVRNALLGCPVPDPELRRRVVQGVFDCVGHGHAALGKSDLQRLAVQQGPLPEELADSLARRTLEAVGDEATNKAAETLGAALERRDTGLGWAARLVRLALERLRGETGLRVSAGKLLRALLLRTDLDADQSAEVVSLALKWLRHQASSPRTARVLGALLTRGGFRGDTKAHSGEAREDEEAHGGEDVAALALTWLEVHPAHPQARHVLPALLAREDLTPAQTAAAVRLATGWLETAQQPDDPAARRLADLLNGRRDATGPQPH